MYEEKITLRMMPWKHKVILVTILLLGTIVMYFTSTSTVIMTRSILLFTILTFASYFDFRFRIIPDWIHLVILVIGFLNINMAMSLFGLVLSPLPFLIMELLHKGSIGGGDIKLLGSIGFVMGYFSTSTASLVALLMVVVVSFLGKTTLRSNRTGYFPFAPYLQMGVTIVMVLVG